MVTKNFTAAALALSVTSAHADISDNWDSFVPSQSYSQTSYDVETECVKRVVSEYVGGEAVMSSDLDDGFRSIHASNNEMDVFISMNGAIERSIVSLEWIEVTRPEHSNHVNLRGNLTDEGFMPFFSSAYSVLPSTDAVPEAIELELRIRECQQALAIG